MDPETGFMDEFDAVDETDEFDTDDEMDVFEAFADVYDAWMDWQTECAMGGTAQEDLRNYGRAMERFTNIRSRTKASAPIRRRTERGEDSTA
jgi:hypothetical protein